MAYVFTSWAVLVQVDFYLLLFVDGTCRTQAMTRIGGGGDSCIRFQKISLGRRP